MTAGESVTQITEILAAWARGDAHAVHRLFPMSGAGAAP